MIEKLLIVIVRLRTALVSFLTQDILLQEHLMSGCQIPSNEEVSLFQILKKILVHTFAVRRNPTGRVVVIRALDWDLLLRLCGIVGLLLALIIISDGSIKVSLLTIGSF
jgi:hypothetical protein